MSADAASSRPVLLLPKELQYHIRHKHLYRGYSGGRPRTGHFSAGTKNGGYGSPAKEREVRDRLPLTFPTMCPYRTIDQVSPPLPAGECTVLRGFGGTLPYGFSCNLPSWHLRQPLIITTMLFSYTASDYELGD